MSQSKLNWKHLMNLNQISVMSCSIPKHTAQKSTSLSALFMPLHYFSNVISSFNPNNSLSLGCSQVGISFSEL